MIIFCSGTKTKTWEVFGNQHIIVVWKYIHFMFCPLAISQKWYIVKGEGEPREINYDEVTSLVPTDTPALNLWQRFGILIPVFFIIYCGVTADPK